MSFEEKIIRKYIFDNTSTKITDISSIINIEIDNELEGDKMYFIFDIDEDKNPYVISNFEWFMSYSLFIRMVRKEKIKCLLMKK